MTGSGEKRILTGLEDIKAGIENSIPKLVKEIIVRIANGEKRIPKKPSIAI